MSNVIVGNNLIAAITGGVYYLTSLARTVEGSEQLLTSPAVILRAYITETLATMTLPTAKTTWPLYVGHFPDGGNVKTNAGCVYDTSGVNDLRQMNGFVPQHFGIQLRIRSRDYEDGWAKIEDVAEELDTANNESITINSIEYEIQNLSRSTPILALGVEPGTKRRYVFTVNYVMSVSNITS